jgi:hypothetical protein
MVEESALFKKHRLKAIECKLRSSKEIIGHKKKKNRWQQDH